MPGGWPPGGIWLADMRGGPAGPVGLVTGHPVGNPAGGRWHLSGSRRRTMGRVPGSGYGGCFIRARRLERGLSASPATPGRRSVPLSRTGLPALPAGTGVTVRRRRMRCPAAAGRPAVARPTSEAIGLAGRISLHRPGVSSPTRSAGWVPPGGGTSASQTRGPPPCIRQVAGSPLTVPTLPAPSSVQARSRLRRPGLTGRGAFPPGSVSGGAPGSRGTSPAPDPRRPVAPVPERGDRRPRTGPPRRQPPGRCPVPDLPPGPMDRAGQVQRRPGHLRVGVPGSPEPRPAWTRHVRWVAAPPRAAAQASQARWPSVTGVPPQAPGNLAAFPCLLESGKGGTAPPRSPGAGQRQPFPMLPGPPGRRPARTGVPSIRMTALPATGATGPRDRPGGAMARLARWIGEPRLAVLPGRRQVPHEPVDGHPGEEGDVGAAAPGDAPAGRGGHGPAGPPDPAGGMAMADGHVPEPAGGGPAVDAVASDLVAVLRQPAGLGRRHGDAGHGSLAAGRSPASPTEPPRSLRRPGLPPLRRLPSLSCPSCPEGASEPFPCLSGRGPYRSRSSRAARAVRAAACARGPAVRPSRAAAVAACSPDSSTSDRSGPSASGGRAPVPSQRDSSRPGPPIPPASGEAVRPSVPDPACATMVAPEVIRPDGHPLTGDALYCQTGKGWMGPDRTPYFNRLLFARTEGPVAVAGKTIDIEACGGPRRRGARKGVRLEVRAGFVGPVPPTDLPKGAPPLRMPAVRVTEPRPPKGKERPAGC